MLRRAIIKKRTKENKNNLKSIEMFRLEKISRSLSLTVIRIRVR